MRTNPRSAWEKPHLSTVAPVRAASSLWRMALCAAALLALGFSSAGAADAERGRALFEGDCGRCHTLRADVPGKRGPHLENLFQRRYGEVEGFPYRMVWKDANPTWTPAHLVNYLNIHGRFDAAQQADVIEYLVKATKK